MSCARALRRPTSTLLNSPFRHSVARRRSRHSPPLQLLLARSPFHSQTPTTSRSGIVHAPSDSSSSSELRVSPSTYPSSLRELAAPSNNSLFPHICTSYSFVVLRCCFCICCTAPVSVHRTRRLLYSLTPFDYSYTVFINRTCRNF